MSAEYMAVCSGRKEYFKAKNLHGFNFETNHITEHFLLKSPYVNMVLLNILEGSWKNQSISWSCSLDNKSYWNDKSVKEIHFSSKYDRDIRDSNKFSQEIIILNNSKKEFIDIAEYSANVINRNFDTVHPFPVLTSVSKTPMGVEDYQIHTEHRGRWAGDKFSIVLSKFEIPTDYENISAFSLASCADEDIYNKNKLLKKSLACKKVDTDSNPSLSLTTLRDNFSREELIDLLKKSQGVELTVYDDISGETILTIENDDKIDNSNRRKWFFFKHAFSGHNLMGDEKKNKIEFSKIITATEIEEYDFIPF